MLDFGGSEGGNPQMVQAMQAHKSAQSAQSLSDLNSNSSGMGNQASSAMGDLSAQSGSSSGGPGGGNLAGSAQGSQKAPAQPPRELGSISEELFQRPVQDIFEEAKSGFDVNKWFGINEIDTPEEKQRKTQLHSRYQQLSQEQQQYFQSRLQRESQRKQRLQQEQKIRDDRKAEENANSIEMPSGQQKGEAGTGAKPRQSRSQMMTKLIDKNRQNLNLVQSAG